MHIRPATALDAHAIAEVNLYTWQTAYRGIISDSYLMNLSLKEYYKKWELHFQQSNTPDFYAFYLVAITDQEKIVGFCTAGSRRKNQLDYPSELYAIYVLQKYQGNGYGHNLVRNAVNRLVSDGYSSMTLWALEKNPYRKFYEKIGGKEINRKKVRIGFRKYSEVEYGWSNLNVLLNSLE